MMQMDHLIEKMYLMVIDMDYWMDWTMRMVLMRGLEIGDGGEPSVWHVETTDVSP